MGEKDITEKILEDHNDVFADIINGLIFAGEQRILPESLENTAVHSQYKADDEKVHELERDVAKYWKDQDVQLAICGIENQSSVEKYMPFRIIGYDGTAYRSQLQDKRKEILPVMTIVLYFGTEHRWYGKRNIKGLMKIPEGLDDYINDYKMQVFEVAWLTEEQISRFRSDFKIVANFFVQKRKNKDYIPDDPTEIKHIDEVLKLLQVMTGDEHYKEVIRKKKGVRSMCDVAERLEKMGIAKGIEIGKSEGIIEGKMQVYKNLLERGFSEKEAKEITEIPETMYGKSLDLEVLIGSVRNTNRIRWIMQKYRPDVVFHAAAHKHVPLMEDSPNEAIKNNVMGTYKTAIAASRAGVKKFVLISTDKAVNPTNIMGASKRLCEMVVQMMNRQSENTDFVAVRFGNVLGSNGSVIPLFKKQIAEGGPVTVTDKNIIRYFMTIPEAVSLVLQAAHYAKGGEIFILDMGEPVRIDEMARNLIRLSGFTPDVDIKVEYTGLRPGEKLFEELLMAEEGMQETPNKLIHIGKPIEMDDAAFKKKLRQLDEAAYQETDRMRKLVAEVVPTYHPENAGNA